MLVVLEHRGRNRVYRDVDVVRFALPDTIILHRGGELVVEWSTQQIDEIYIFEDGENQS